MNRDTVASVGVALLILGIVWSVTLWLARPAYWLLGMVVLSIGLVLVGYGIGDES